MRDEIRRLQAAAMAAIMGPWLEVRRGEAGDGIALWHDPTPGANARVVVFEGGLPAPTKVGDWVAVQIVRVAKDERTIVAKVTTLAIHGDNLPVFGTGTNLREARRAFGAELPALMESHMEWLESRDIEAARAAEVARLGRMDEVLTQIRSCQTPEAVRQNRVTMLRAAADAIQRATDALDNGDESFESALPELGAVLRLAAKEIAR